MRPLFEDALAHGHSRRRFRRGDYDSAVEGSRPLAATYFVAPSQHLALEPLTATARFSDGRLEMWAPTQAPGLARAAAATAANIRSSDVTLYPMPVGAPSGRAMEADAIPYAIALARQLKAPVQVMLSQARSQNHDVVAPGALARMTALPGQGGITAAWKMQIATVDGMGSAVSRLLGAEESGKIARTAIAGLPPYAVPNVMVEAVPAQLPFRAGYMRGSPQREICFFTESFIDELARAAGLEPLAFRMSMLGENGRLARCLQGAARLAQWDGGGAGSTMGIAGCSAFGSHIGLVATASIGADQRVRVAPARRRRRLRANRQFRHRQAADRKRADLGPWPGHGGETRMAGRNARRARSMLGLPRIGEAPEIFVQLIPSSAAPGGASGLGTTVLAPAIANALYAGTGRRMRDLPFDPMAARGEYSRSADRGAADQSRHARCARSPGGPALPRRVPERPAGDRNPGDRVEADPARPYPAHAAAPIRRGVQPGLDQRGLSACGHRAATGACPARPARGAGAVHHAMRYGNPGIAAALENMLDEGCTRILAAPLYPQYCAATTATANDAVFAVLARMRVQPALRTLPPYYDDPLLYRCAARQSVAATG